jgi:hypothetical protein
MIIFLDLFAVLHLLFAYVELSLYPWSESNLIMVYYLFNVLLNYVCKCFVEDLCVYVHQGNWSIIYFVVSLSSFDIRIILDSLNDFGSVPSLYVLWNNLRDTGISSPLKIW